MVKERKKKYIQSKKWFVTQESPTKYGFKDLQDFYDRVRSLNPVWAVFSKECGEKTKREHYHSAIVFDRAVRNTTIAKVLSHANLATGRGTYEEMRNYVLKIGVKNEDKQSTSMETLEFGDMPLTAEEKKDDKYKQLLKDIKSGKSVLEIIEEKPESFIYKLKQINELRQKYLGKLYLGKPRTTPLQVLVRCGAAGTGKTRAVMEEFGNDVYRVTVYRKYGLGPYYDGYDGHKCLCFEEFNSGLVPIEEMLTITDPYYYSELNCRYQNAIGIYDVVVINTNILFENLYRDLTTSFQTMEKYRAWLRRITEIQLYKANGTIEKYTVGDYLKKVTEYDKNLLQEISSYNNYCKGE